MRKTFSPKIEQLLGKMTLDEKILLLHGQTNDKYRGNQAGFVHGIEKYGIPDVFICDGESGVNTSWDCTAMPAKVGLAASFDKRAAYEYGYQLGLEAKASGMNVLLTPRVNIVRDSITSREGSNGGNYQTYGEDPVLNSRLGEQEALGIQADNHAVANLKQMLGSSTGTAQGAGNVIMDEQTLHEIYAKPFERTIRAGVGATMTNYNQVNGVWSYKFKEMTERLCREAWGFDGFIDDDWLCLYEPEAILGGVTLEMPGEDAYGTGSQKSMYGDRLKACIADPHNPITEDDIDTAVGYYLTTLERFDVLGHQRLPGPIDEETKHRGISEARRIAGKCATLLKNDGILPLTNTSQKVAMVGAGAIGQVMPTFKEAAYGFAERKIGAAEAARREGAFQVVQSVGDDLDGTLIPSACLKDGDGVPGGISLNYVEYARRLLEDGRIGELPAVIRSIGRQESAAINGLPAQTEALEHTFDSPDRFYMVHGSILAPETGLYRLALQTSMPGVDEFEKNQIQSSDMTVISSGGLYFKNDGEELYVNVAEGIRTMMNGGAVPNSDILPCADGFNNMGAYVYMEAGKEYPFVGLARNLYKEPLDIRLCWVTPSMAEKNIREAEQNAANCDVAVVFVWHKTSDTLSLPGYQDALIERVAAANSNTIVVLNNGDPVLMPWESKVKGILEMWYSGQEGSLATIDVLTGKVNPAGRCPVTFPKKLTDTAVHDPNHPERFAKPGRVHDKDWLCPNPAVFSEGIFVGYRHFDEYEITPQYEFGYGLSYTQFEYSGLEIEKKPDGYRVSLTVTNIGSCDGEEVVQLYLGRPASVPAGVQAAKQALCDFERVSIPKGSSCAVTLEIPEQSLCYWAASEKKECFNGAWKPLTGEREVRVGASSRDIRLVGYIKV